MATTRPQPLRAEKHLGNGKPNLNCKVKMRRGAAHGRGALGRGCNKVGRLFYRFSKVGKKDTPEKEERERENKEYFGFFFCGFFDEIVPRTQRL